MTVSAIIVLWIVGIVAFVLGALWGGRQGVDAIRLHDALTNLWLYPNSVAARETAATVIREERPS